MVELQSIDKWLLEEEEGKLRIEYILDYICSHKERNLIAKIDGFREFGIKGNLFEIIDELNLRFRDLEYPISADYYRYSPYRQNPQITFRKKSSKVIIIRTKSKIKVKSEEEKIKHNEYIDFLLQIIKKKKEELKIQNVQKTKEISKAVKGTFLEVDAPTKNDEQKEEDKVNEWRRSLDKTKG